MAAQGAELKLRVSLDLTTLRRQLNSISTELGGQGITVPLKLDRQNIANEFRRLNTYIGNKKFNIEINTNLESEIKNADRLVKALQRVQSTAGGARGTSPVGTAQLGRTAGQGGFSRAQIKSLFSAAIQGGLLDERTLGRTRTQMVAALGSIGRDSIEGLLNGLSSGDAQLRAAAESLGDSLIAALKTALGIASPSKETGKLGKFAAEGFEKGFVSGMVKAERTMANAIRSAVIGSIREGLSNLPGLGGALVGFERQLAASVQLAVRRAMREGLGASIGPGARGTLLGGAGGAATGAAVGGAKALGGGIAGGVAKLTAGGLMGTAANLARYSLDNSAYQEFVGKLYQEIINSALSSGTQGAVIGALAVGGVAGGIGFARGATGSLVIQAVTAIRNRILAALLAVSTGELNNVVKVMVRDVTGALFTNTIRQLRSASQGLPRIDWPAVAPSITASIGPSTSGRLLTGTPSRGMIAGSAPAALLPSVSQTLEQRKSTASGVQAIRAMMAGSGVEEPPGKLVSLESGFIVAMRERFARAAERYLFGVETQVVDLFDSAQAAVRVQVDRMIAQIEADIRARARAGVAVRDLGTTIQPLLAGAVSPQRLMLPPAGGTGGGGRKPPVGGGFVPPDGFPTEGMLAPSSAYRPAQTELGAGYFAAGKAIKSFGEEYNKIRGFLNQNRLPLGGAIAEVGEEFGMALKQVFLYGAAYKALAFFTDLPNQAFDAAKALATYQNQLKAVTDATGTFERSTAFVENLAQRFNMPIESARQGFVKLYASMQPAGFSQQEIEGLFTGISKATAAFGLSADQVDRVNYAFAQMASKGQIMSEELKGQLGDVLPGSLALFAQAAQMSIPEFSKAMEDGAFKGQAMQQVLGNVAILMNNKFGPAAQLAAKTLQGALNQIQNNLKLMYEAFTPIVNGFASAFGPAANSLIKDVTNTVKVLTSSFVKGSDGLSTLSPRALAFYNIIQQLKPAIQAATVSIGSLASTFAQLAPLIFTTIEAVLRFIASPLGRFAIITTAAITVLNGAITLLTSVGLLPALNAVYKFIGGLMAIPAASGAARIAVVALKLAITGLFVGAVLIGLDFVIGKILGIGEAANDAKGKTRELAYTLNEMANIGDIPGLARKRQEAENEVIIAERLLQTYQKMQRVERTLQGEPLTRQEKEFLKQYGAKNILGQSRVAPETGIAFAESKLATALEKRGLAQKSLEAAQRAADRERQKSEQQLQKITFSGEDQKKTSLESYYSLQDQLAKNFTQAEIERIQSSHEHRVKMMNLFYDLEEARANSFQKETIRFQKEVFNILADQQSMMLKASTQIMEARGSVSGAYLQGNIGPTSTGPHFDVKKVGGGYFPRNYLDPYVQVNGRPLSSGTTVPGGTFAGHQRRGSHGWDYAFGQGRFAATLAGGAQWMGGAPTAHGEQRRFRLPSGEEFQFLHGRSEGIGAGAPRRVPGSEKRDVVAKQKEQLALQNQINVTREQEAQTIMRLQLATENYVASLIPTAEQELQNQILQRRLELTSSIASPEILAAQTSYAEQEMKTAVAIKLNNQNIAELSRQVDRNGKLYPIAAQQIEVYRKANADLQRSLPASQIQLLTNEILKQSLALQERLQSSQRDAEDRRKLNQLIIGGLSEEAAQAKITADRLREDYATALRLANEVVNKASADLEVFNLRKAQGIALTKGETDEYNRLTEALNNALKARQDLEGRGAGIASTAQGTEQAAKAKPGDGIVQGIADAQKKLNDLTNVEKQVVAGANAIGSAFGQAFRDIASGSQTTQEALSSMFQSIADHFFDMAAQIISQMLVMYTLKLILGLFGGGGGFSYSGANHSGAFGSGSPVNFNPGAFSMPKLAAEGAYWSGGFQAFASGGFVSGPTLGLVGEGSEAEYIIPASKMRSAMNRYASGARGSSVIPGNGESDGGPTSGLAAMNASSIDVRYTVERINSVDYVTADQFRAGMAQAAQQGATQGEQRTLRRLQQSRATRSRLGMN
jgi:tape measure domain-containing protein